MAGKGGVVLHVAKEVFAQAAGGVVADIFGVVREIAEPLRLDRRNRAGKVRRDAGEDLPSASLSVVGVGRLQRDTPITEVIGFVTKLVHPELVLILVVDFLAVGEVSVDGEQALGADELLELGVELVVALANRTEAAPLVGGLINAVDEELGVGGEQAAIVAGEGA